MWVAWAGLIRHLNVTGSFSVKKICTDDELYFTRFEVLPILFLVLCDRAIEDPRHVTSMSAPILVLSDYICHSRLWSDVRRFLGEISIDSQPAAVAHIVKIPHFARKLVV